MRGEKCYHLRELKNVLRLASDRARDGNREATEHWLAKAEDHARGAGIEEEKFEPKFAGIRGQLQNENEFHLEMYEDHLREAEQWARQSAAGERGCRSLVLNHLWEAEKHAKSAGVYDEELFGRRYASIVGRLPVGLNP